MRNCNCRPHHLPIPKIHNPFAFKPHINYDRPRCYYIIPGLIQSRFVWGSVLRPLGSGRGTLTPEMEQTLHITQSMRRVKNSLLWGSVNALILAIVLYDISYTCPLYTTTIHFIEKCLAGLLTLNTIFHFGRYLWTTATLQPIVLTPRQKSLLGIKDSEPYFKTSTPLRALNTTVDPSFCVTPMNLSSNSWLSTSVYSTDHNESTTSPNFSQTSPSWVYHSGSPSRLLHSTPSAQDEIIENEESLKQYLAEYDSFEKSSIVISSTEQPSNLLSGFWSHPASRSASEVSPLLRRCAYQISSPSDQTMSGARSGDEAGCPSHHHADVWRKNSVNPTLLTQWTSNLRMWISQTILNRLVKEIETVDKGLHGQGLVDISIGMVGLERLKKTAQSPQVLFNVPSLQSLVPFLDISPYQEYVVSRIKELARGGCMNEYKWNSGGHWNGKEWADHLPTDALLVMHLLATYLDLQLPSVAPSPDGRPFSSQYLVKYPNKPTKHMLAIIQESIQPPHYQIQTKDGMFDIPKGRNNLLHAILLFLHTIKIKNHSMLGRMNLGRSGVNMLWIIES